MNAKLRRSRELEKGNCSVGELCSPWEGEKRACSVKLGYDGYLPIFEASHRPSTLVWEESGEVREEQLL